MKYSPINIKYREMLKNRAIKNSTEIIGFLVIIIEIPKKIHNKDKTKEIKLTHKDLIKMAMIIKQVIFDLFPILEKVYVYYMDIANLMNTLKLPLQWITPNGTIITQNYLKEEKKRIGFFSKKEKKIPWKFIKNKEGQY